jgi:hypothetical protein
MANVTHFTAAGSRFTHAGRIENAMTDFLSVMQALKAVNDSGEDYACARAFLIEKLEETYQRLDEAHREGSAH